VVADTKSQLAKAASVPVQEVPAFHVNKIDVKNGEP
jgi:hypothetical protein